MPDFDAQPPGGGTPPPRGNFPRCRARPGCGTGRQALGWHLKPVTTTRLICCLLLALAPWDARGADERLYVNDLKAPESRKDLEAIQGALGKALGQARSATVCLEVGEGSGSGVIVAADGLILTAAHVSGGVHKKITVILEDGTRLKGETLGLVANTDAAMVRILEPGTYPFVEIERSRSTRLGDWVFALSLIHI